jgi:radical SAM protein with 4Fe4S-binding SPASM domain
MLHNYKQTVGYYEKMDMGLYEKIIGDVEEMGRLKALKLFGYGEPMLHPELPRMVELGKTISDRVEFTSNLTALTETMARGLIDAKLDYLRCSIYSTNQEAHEKFTQVKFKIDRIYENLRRLRELRDEAGSDYPFIYVKMFETITDAEAEIFREKYKDIADEIAFEIIHNMSGYDNVEEKLGIPIPIRTPHRVCPLSFYQTAIGSNGDVTVCCIDWSFSSKVGNIREQSLSEIWNGEKLRKFHIDTLEGRGREYASCTNCTWNWAQPESDNLDDVTEEKIKEFYA